MNLPASKDAPENRTTGEIDVGDSFIESRYEARREEKEGPVTTRKIKFEIQNIGECPA